MIVNSKAYLQQVKIAQNLWGSFDVNDNIRMYKKWKIKMYKNEYFYIP